MVTQLTSRCNIVDYPGRPVRERDRELDSELVTSSGGARARTRGVSDAGDMLRSAAECYCDTLGRARCPPSIMREMADAIDQGMTDAVICAALVAASDAPRPSWAYARAIMGRCLADGCLDADGWAARCAAHRATQHAAGGSAGESASSAANSALNYAQRSYPPGYFDGFFADLH